MWPFSVFLATRQLYFKCIVNYYQIQSTTFSLFNERFPFPVKSACHSNTITKPQISAFSLLRHVTCVISSQSRLLNPLDHPYWSLFFNHQLTPVSRSQTTLIGMLHLTRGTSFPRLFVFLISLIHRSSPSSSHHHAMILDWLLTFLTAFSTSVLKLSLLCELC